MANGEKVVVVLGAGYAGVLAAIRAKKRGGAGVSVVLVSDRDVFVERIRLHERAVNGRVVEHRLSTLLHGSGVEHRLAMVVSIATDRKQVVLTDGGDISYDKLIVAVGSSTDAAGGPPGVREHAFTLDPRAAERLRLAITETAKKPKGRIVVCGAGLTGVELAAELAERHPTLEVTLLTNEVAPLLAERPRTAIRAALAQLGVRVVENANIEAIEPDAVVAQQRHPFDVCVWTAGVKATPLAARAGFAVNARGQALVDPCLHPLCEEDVYVVGDAAAFVVDPGMPIVMGCKTAMPMGALAADNAIASLRGREETPFDFRDTGYCVSLGRRRGVIQIGQGARMVTGRFGALIKEMICRLTLLTLKWERFAFFTYTWLHTGRAPRALPENPIAALPAAKVA